MDLRKLTVQQANAIDLLVTGCSDREAAEAVGVTRSTVTRWRLYHPAFQAELNAQRAALWGAAKEKLRSLIPEAVDVIANAIRDPANDDRAKLALDLIKSVKASEDLDSYGSTEADEIIEKAAARSPFSTLTAPSAWDIRVRESELQARLNGMTVAELSALIDDAEKARKKAKREARKAEKQLAEPILSDAPSHELAPAHEDASEDPEAPELDEDLEDTAPDPAPVSPCQQPITILDEPPPIPRPAPAEVLLSCDEVIE
jgi:hypothetical protein